MQTQHRRFLLLSVVAVALQLVSFLKITPSFGSITFYFTGMSIMAPLLGVFLRTHEIMLLVFGTALVRWFGFGANMPIFFLTFGLPTLVSSLVFRVSPFGKSVSRKADDQAGIHINRRMRNATDRMLSSYADMCFRLFLPLLCMTLFVIHPVGSKAAAFAIYWLIPVGLYTIFTLKPALRAYHHVSLFATALSATFLMHAVGSIMWLYSLNLPAQYWLSLVPVVPIERIIFASGICACYAIAHRVYVHYKHRGTKTLATA